MMLVLGLVLGGLSSLAHADRPGWIPNEFKRGGGDELESSAHDDLIGDEEALGVAPSDLGLVGGLEMDDGSGSQAMSDPASGPAHWLWWQFLSSWRW